MQASTTNSSDQKLNDLERVNYLLQCLEDEILKYIFEAAETGKRINFNHIAGLFFATKNAIKN